METQGRGRSEEDRNEPVARSQTGDSDGWTMEGRCPHDILWARFEGEGVLVVGGRCRDGRVYRRPCRIPDLRRGSLMEITDDHAKNVCRLGQGEKCCAFLASRARWECAKDIPGIRDAI